MSKPVEYIAATIWDNTPPELRFPRIGLNDNTTFSGGSFADLPDSIQELYTNKLIELNYIKS